MWRTFEPDPFVSAGVRASNRTANVVNRLFSLVSFRVSLCRLGVCVRPVKCGAAAVVKMRRRAAGQFQFVHGLGVRPGWRDVFSFEKNRSV